ncbi:hypothetical protein BOTBODRAFT_30549 [Botryobasidium botryosum FD-172 SS1]|uniref:RGS domain-containing protein n=1 Tax=Botryobasidium botryosum (strain FD-172 SS1) TaxID=930990 RepID=A0A067MYK4_BOTB1|nr:hypothetical protein BOTBODRAFT_30549 [Botryobasidium botryosum FD-172 SS1]
MEEKNQLDYIETGKEDLRNRLPSFDEVLSRKTRPPVDLFMFYLFLQREGAEDVLDFWLDIQQHENLCRAYFKDVRKSGRTIREDWPQYWDFARRRGSIYGAVVGGKQSANSEDRLSAPSPSPRPHTPSITFDQQQQQPQPRVQYQSQDQPTPRSSTPFSQIARRASAMVKRASRAPTIIPRDAAITRADLVASAERIFARYLLQGAEKEVYLPPALRIHAFPLNSADMPNPNNSDYDVQMSALAQIPDMFHAQKEYVFRAMEQDAFPRFLRAKAFGNLTPVSALVRLCAGLLVLWVGLATAFSLVFLDVKPKSKRFFLFIPFTFAILFLISHQYELDPILVFLGQSETTPFRTLRIREPYVKKLLLGRAIWVTFLVTVCVTALTLLFWAVPGHRL